LSIYVYKSMALGRVLANYVALLWVAVGQPYCCTCTIHYPLELCRITWRDMLTNSISGAWYGILPFSTSHGQSLPKRTERTSDVSEQTKHIARCETPILYLVFDIGSFLSPPHMDRVRRRERNVPPTFRSKQSILRDAKTQFYIWCLIWDPSFLHLTWTESAEGNGTYLRRFGANKAHCAMRKPKDDKNLNKNRCENLKTNFCHIAKIT